MLFEMFRLQYQFTPVNGSTNIVTPSSYHSYPGRVSTSTDNENCTTTNNIAVALAQRGTGPDNQIGVYFPYQPANDGWFSIALPTAYAALPEIHRNQSLAGAVIFLPFGSLGIDSVRKSVEALIKLGTWNMVGIPTTGIGRADEWTWEEIVVIILSSFPGTLFNMVHTVPQHDTDGTNLTSDAKMINMCDTWLTSGPKNLIVFFGDDQTKSDTTAGNVESSGRLFSIPYARDWGRIYANGANIVRGAVGANNQWHYWASIWTSEGQYHPEKGYNQMYEVSYFASIMAEAQDWSSVISRTIAKWSRVMNCADQAACARNKFMMTTCGVTLMNQSSIPEFYATGDPLQYCPKVAPVPRVLDDGSTGDDRQANLHSIFLSNSGASGTIRDDGTVAYSLSQLVNGGVSIVLQEGSALLRLFHEMGILIRKESPSIEVYDIRGMETPMIIEGEMICQAIAAATENYLWPIMSNNLCGGIESDAYRFGQVLYGSIMRDYPHVIHNYINDALGNELCNYASSSLANSSVSHEHALDGGKVTTYSVAPEYRSVFDDIILLGEQWVDQSNFSSANHQHTSRPGTSQELVQFYLPDAPKLRFCCSLKAQDVRITSYPYVIEDGFAPRSMTNLAGVFTDLYPTRRYIEFADTQVWSKTALVEYYNALITALSPQPNNNNTFDVIGWGPGINRSILNNNESILGWKGTVEPIAGLPLGLKKIGTSPVYIRGPVMLTMPLRNIDDDVALGYFCHGFIQNGNAANADLGVTYSTQPVTNDSIVSSRMFLTGPLARIPGYKGSWDVHKYYDEYKKFNPSASNSDKIVEVSKNSLPSSENGQLDGGAEKQDQ
jgi:hypothetical protein